MRQTMIDAYTAWINWSFDNPWVFVLGIVLYAGALYIQHKHPRKPWRR